MRAHVVMAVMLMVGHGHIIVPAQAPPPIRKDMQMQHAKGTFEVKMLPAEGTEHEKKLGIGRMTFTKFWHGDFEGTSEGEMLGVSGETSGAMAYVAIERMSGKLAGREGTFLFTHQATMMKGDAKSGVMVITVVPNSATGDLTGLTGKLNIVIDDSGNHSWVFDYGLP